MTVANAPAQTRRWMALVLAALLLPALGSAVDCFCLLPSADRSQPAASACAASADAGCCAGCCQGEERTPPAETPAKRQFPVRIIGALLGANFCPRATPPLPPGRAGLPLPAWTASSAELAAFAADYVSSAYLPGVPAGREYLPPAESLLTLLRRCQPGNAPPLS